jgi:hypothetical protein
MLLIFLTLANSILRHSEDRTSKVRDSVLGRRWRAAIAILVANSRIDEAAASTNTSGSPRSPVVASSSSLSDRETTASRRVELLAIGGIASYRRLKGDSTLREFLTLTGASSAPGVVLGAPLEECLLLGLSAVGLGSSGRPNKGLSRKWLRNHDLEFLLKGAAWIDEGPGAGTGVGNRESQLLCMLWRLK